MSSTLPTVGMPIGLGNTIPGIASGFCRHDVADFADMQRRLLTLRQTAA